MATIKWITIQEYVDLQTGEIISKSRYLRENYITIRQTKIAKIENEKYGIITRTNECRKSGQLNIF